MRKAARPGGTCRLCIVSLSHYRGLNFSDPFGLCPQCLLSVAEGWAIAKLTGDDYSWGDAATDAALGAAGVGAAVGAAKLGRVAYRAYRASRMAKSIGFGTKIGKQLGKRGWDEASVKGLVKDPAKTVKTRDTRFNPDGSRMDDPATAYIDNDGHYVVVNDKTKDVVQVSNRNDPNWKSPFDQ